MPALLIATLYVVALFYVAHRVDRFGLPSALKPYVYPLSAAIFFSAWSFYGGIGSAASGGWNYLSLYHGPTLLLLLAPGLLPRIVTYAKAHGANSISELISAGYGKSRSVAAIVTLIALTATIPYLAIQLRSVSTSLAHLSGSPSANGASFIVAPLLAAFAIFFGARRYDVGGRNRGLMAAIALESLIKLAAILILALFALALFFSAPAAPRAAGVASFADIFDAASFGGDFLVQLFVSAAALFCLPRQFYVMVVEADDADQARGVRWPFILYNAAISLFVALVTLAGFTYLSTSRTADFLVLDLPLATGHVSLALIAFLGGFSAATAMVIVETLALSTMIANDLIAPLLLRIDRVRRDHDLGRLLLLSRRMVIVAIVAVALLYGQSIRDERPLSAIGLVAFAGFAQLTPALLATIFWNWNRTGAARSALIAGYLVWGYCLFLPSVGAGQLTAALATWTGGLLDPHRLFGIEIGSPLLHGVVWSLGLNTLLLVLGSWRVTSRLLGWADASARSLDIGSVHTNADLRALAARFIGEAEAQHILGDAPGDAAVDGRRAKLAERAIAGVIGVPSARLIITSAMAGGALDISDVVRLLDSSSHSLQFSRALLAATFESIDPGVCVVDRNLRLVAWNRPYTALFEYPPDLLAVGQPVGHLIRFVADRDGHHPDDIDRYVERRLQHLRRGLPYSSERTMASGRAIKIVGGPMPDGGYVMSFTDISAEKATQAELEARVQSRTHELEVAKAAAELATRQKTRLLAAASHDLLQPLHAARLFCAAYLGKQRRPDPLVAKIDAAIVSADSMLRSLLDISKLDAGGITPRPRRFALEELVSELVSEFERLAADRGLRFKAINRSAAVETDRALLRSILQNYLSNAVRYTISGTVMLAVRRRGAAVRIEVRDSGPGIPIEKQKAIFEEFEQLDIPGSAGGGAGLGLAIVERIARLLEIRIDLRSQPGRGSVFAVTLPCAAQESMAGPSHGKAERVRPARNLSLLCLDNDNRVLDAIEALLRTHDCHAITLSDPEEAIAVATWQHLDAALLDLQLDHAIDGLDVAKELRSISPEMPIALVTANASPEVLIRAEAMRVSVISKPVVPQELWEFLTPAPRATVD